MKKNMEVDYKELERLAAFGGSDRDGEVNPDGISAVVSATVKLCLPAISAVGVCQVSCRIFL